MGIRTKVQAQIQIQVWILLFLLSPSLFLPRATGERATPRRLKTLSRTRPEMQLRTATLAILTLGTSPVSASPVIDGLTSTVIFKLLPSQPDHESAAASIAAQAGLEAPRRSECMLTSLYSDSHSLSFAATHFFGSLPMHSLSTCWYERGDAHCCRPSPVV